MSRTTLSRRCRDAGDAYFMAMEALGHDVGIELRCTLRQPVAPDRVLAAFEALLRACPALRMRRQPDPDGAGWSWQALDEDGALALWQPQALALRAGRAGPALRDGLPLLLVDLQEHTLVFRADHTFANGRAAFAWIARFLAVLHGEPATDLAGAPAAGGPVASLPRALAQFMRQSWARRSLGAHRRDPGARLRPAEPPQAGWVNREWTVPLAALEALLRAHGLGQSAGWTQALSQALSQHLLASLPELPGLPLQWAIDLHEACGEPVTAQGNYTALVGAYVGREHGQAQLHRLMQDVRQGLGPAQARLIQLQAARRPAMIRWFARHLWPRPNGAPRAAAMDPVLTLSNVGRLHEPAFEQWVEKASLWTRTPSLYLSCTTVGAQATLALSFPRQLFDEARLCASLEAWVAQVQRGSGPGERPATALAEEHPLMPRHFQLDLQRGLPLHWNGSPFRSQFFNSVSLLLPAGERWIIDTVRRTIETLPEPLRSEWSTYGRDFIAQESIHRALHRKYNEQTTAQGLQDWIGGKVEQRITWGERGTPISQLASSVTFEYITTLFCTRVIRDPSWLDGADPQMARLWLWHVCEELEHKHFVLDLFRAAGGGEWRRIGWFIWFSSSFMKDLHYQLYLALRGSGQLWRWRTWRDAAVFYFGRRGMAWLFMGGSLRFLRPGFRHPEGPEDRLARQWFQSNPQAFVEGRTAPSSAAGIRA